ncbi:MAG: hotdog fold thioesterase [Chloroflexi bacterium]|nr:MAG: hotdog fold thioesterase [Chloroflexota bacterium]
MPFAAAAGIEIDTASAEEVTGRMPWAPERCTTLGILHGGALMTFADTLGALCAFLNLPPGAGTSTIESKTNFFRAVREGQVVHARSFPLHTGRTVIVVQTDLGDGNGKRVAQPERRNALSSNTLAALHREFDRIAGDPAVRVVVLTGEGIGFCAGADIKSGPEDSDDLGGVPGGELLSRVSNPTVVTFAAQELMASLFEKIHRLRVPVIAAVNGAAHGGGFALALACDIRIASERARFGSFEARRGFHHADGGIVRLVNICGAGVALEMLLTAEPIDAERALRCNLVSRVVPHERLMEEAHTVARQILRNSQTAVRSAKETILDIIGRPLDDQLRIEALNGYSSLGADTADRLQRFYEKTDAGRAGRSETPLP